MTIACELGAHFLDHLHIAYEEVEYTMAQASKQKVVSSLVLEENGIVRSTVFPNAMRDVRLRRGFESLKSFDSQVDITYTRLAKIERGEIFPTAKEMISISRAMGVPVSSLLIDQKDPAFDREKWARSHIEASLSHRGGGLEDMKLGAAMRVCRLALGNSTTDMKGFGLPAATVSRIENADRPFDRWDAQTQKGIAQVLATFGGASIKGYTGIRKKVNEMYKAGILDPQLHHLFSKEAIEERNNRKLKALLEELPEGKRVSKLLNDLQESENDISILVGTKNDDGSFTVHSSSQKVAPPIGAGRNSIALEVVEPVLGPGLPKGTVIVADPEQEVSDGDVAIILNSSRTEAKLLSIAKDKNGLVGFSMAIEKPIQISKLPRTSVIAKMIAAVV